MAHIELVIQEANTVYSIFAAKSTALLAMHKSSSRNRNKLPNSYINIEN